MDLTVLVPGIRTDRWLKLYKSVENTFSGTWEMIFISPYDIPRDMSKCKHAKLIKDWGTPIRCQQIGLCAAKGDWVTWAADDGKFLPEALDVSFELLNEHNFDYKTLVMGKYMEGSENPKMRELDYYILSKHDASYTQYLPQDFLMLNVGVVSRKVLHEIGGWDCQFEVCPVAYNDLAYRLQLYGIKFIVQKNLMFTCSHMPHRTGDHGPIHDAQIDHDQPLFRLIWRTPDYVNRNKIDIYNWKQSPEKWLRRFKD